MRTHLSATKPIADWPEEDRRAWMAAQEGDPFAPGDGGAVASWRAISIQSAQANYGRWLDWQDKRGELDGQERPAARITLGRVRAYRQDLIDLGYADASIARRMRDLVDVARAIDPGCDLDLLGLAAHRLAKDSVRKRPIKSRMRPPSEVYDLGLSLMELAHEKKRMSAIGRAKLFRDGLILAFAVACPFRVSNLAGIRLGQELVKIDQQWLLRFSEESMKNARAYECPWPDPLVGALEHYLSHVRPVLAARGPTEAHGDHLWLSSTGRGMSRHMISYPIRTRTEKAFGVAIFPHLIRHIVSTGVATDRPEEVHDIVAILGHSSLAVSEKHYNQAGGVRATTAYAKALQARGLGRGPKRGPRWN